MPINKQKTKQPIFVHLYAQNYKNKSAIHSYAFMQYAYIHINNNITIMHIYIQKNVNIHICKKKNTSIQLASRSPLEHISYVNVDNPGVSHTRLSCFFICSLYISSNLSHLIR